MSEELTGEQLKGIRRFVILRDGMPRELAYDFNALACYERNFIMPEVETFERLVEQHPKGVPAQLLKNIRPRLGLMENSARWAYCLCSTWREDNGEDAMTYVQFKRLLPAGPGFEAACQNWQTSVQAVLHIEQGESSGNAPGGEEPPPTSTSPEEYPGALSTTPQL